MLAPATFIAIYFVTWWVCLFIVLPFGVRNQVEAGEVTPGTERGAPVQPMLLRRVLWTTALSIPVSGLVIWSLTAGWLQRYWN